jgi:hypothetical protein
MMVDRREKEKQAASCFQIGYKNEIWGVAKTRVHLRTSTIT